MTTGMAGIATIDHHPHLDDHHLTTSITPWVRYWYKMVHQGYTASDNSYSWWFLMRSSPTSPTKKSASNTLWADNLTESFFQAVDWLDLCGHHGIAIDNKCLWSQCRWICRIQNHPSECKAMQEISWRHPPLSNPCQHNRLLVWTHKPVIICICLHQTQDTILAATSTSFHQLNLWSSAKLKRVSAYLINPNWLAWPLTGQKMTLVNGHLKNTVNVHPLSPSPAVQAGK